MPRKHANALARLLYGISQLMQAAHAKILQHCLYKTKIALF